MEGSWPSSPVCGAATSFYLCGWPSMKEYELGKRHWWLSQNKNGDSQHVFQQIVLALAEGELGNHLRPPNFIQLGCSLISKQNVNYVK